MKYILFASILLLAACGSTTEIEQVKPVEVITVEIPRPAPIVPPVDQLKLRSIEWVVITSDNIEENFDRIQNGEMVFFALTTEGYESLSLNISDIRSMIEQQQKIIAIYEKQFSS